ncbi:MAG: peptidase M23 [Deltaproteobacteria bacterium]|nr:MAG: peptidase M23 [Deltaproteobacteria bacterium]
MTDTTPSRSCAGGSAPVERIVVVTTSFPRTADDAAGHFVEAQAQALASQGHDVHVICAGGTWRQTPEQRGKITIHWAGGGGLFTWPGALSRLREAPWRAVELLSYAAGVRWRLKKLGPVQRAEAHWLVPSAWPLLAACDVPLTVVAHGADVRLLCSLPRALRRHIVDHLLGREANFRFVAQDLERQLLDRLDPHQAAAVARRSKVQPCPLTIPAASKPSAATRAATRRALGCPASAPLAVVVGRLVVDKRVDLAIRGTAQMPTPPHLAVIGGGPLRTTLQQLAQRLGVAATFVGQRPRSECLAAIAAADVLVHCSAVEAAPSVIREARAYGIAVVATPSGDVGRWAEQDPQIVTAAPNPPAIAAALQAVLERRNPAPRLQNDPTRGTNPSC